MKLLLDQRLSVLFVVLTLFCLAPITLCAADKPVTIEVAGEAAGSDLESPREVCDRAKAEAQRNALEMAIGTFVRSHTIVTNGQLAEDLIHTGVRGKIERLEVLKQERTPADNGCRVHIRAVVQPVYPDAHNSIQVKLAMTRTAVQEGDEIGIQYQVNRDSHVYLFVISADNSVTQLLPNSRIPVNRAVAHQQYLFPPVDSGIRLKAALLPGFRKSGAEERIKIIATSHPEPLLEKGFQEGFAVYDAHSTGLISDLLKRLNQLEPADWGEATVGYSIGPR
jgi:Domain of unknown function (DUF4384)